MQRLKILVAVLLWCGLCTAITLAKQQPPNREPNRPDYGKVIGPDNLKEDLDFLFKTIEEVHPNMYAYINKEEFQPIRDQLYRKIDGQLTRAEFYRLAAPVVASLKSFHTLILPFVDEYEEYAKDGGRLFPLELTMDNSKVVLAKNYSNISMPMGGAVLAINDRQASELFAGFASWIPAENRNTNPWLVEHPVFLRCLLLLEFGPVKSWSLRIQAPDDSVADYTFAALALTDFASGEEAATIERKKYCRVIPESNTAIIKFLKWREPEEFKVFLNRAFKDIRDEKVLNLIIDLRENTGGTDECVHILMEYLAAKPYRKYDRVDMSIRPQTRERIDSLRREFPDKFADVKNGDIVSIELPMQPPADNPLRFTGRTLVLISARSFSASTVFASIVKCAKIATLIGQATGDPTTLYADSIEFELPHSALHAWVASKLLVCACGKPDGRGVIPDYEVKQTPEDTAKGVDTVLQFTLDLIKRSGEKSGSTPHE
ncbi:MAG: S41 family peptidase [Planctomycetota bacterium]